MILFFYVINVLICLIVNLTQIKTQYPMMHKKIYWYNMSDSYIAVPLMFLHTSYLKNLINILVHYKMHIEFILYFKEKSSIIVCVSVTIKAHKQYQCVY